jgi:ABC-type antimicrobial peptide transport system permease subunit
MILRNLLRRKGRTLLTILGISIGVAAIIGLGALANGLDAGYSAMLSGSQADLVLSQPDSFDISYSSIDESLAEQVKVMPEVRTITSMIQGFVSTEGSPFIFVFGYPQDSFLLNRFQVTEGVSVFGREARQAHSKVVMIGSAAAEAFSKRVGESLRIGGSVYRIVGIYQTGEAFEDGGIILPLPEAQTLLGKPRQVSVFYVQLKEPALKERFVQRVERQIKELKVGTTGEFAETQSFGETMRAFVGIIAGLAIIIGGVGMMNAQLMAVVERTREIGVLRAVGWSSFRVLQMILGESLIVSLLGGGLGLAIGWGALYGLRAIAMAFGAGNASLQPELIRQAALVVLVLGLAGGLYPAWRASRLQPVEALRYEGGSSGSRVHRLPFGGMAIQSLWQRSTRTLLTLGAISLTVGAIMILEAMVEGAEVSFGQMAVGADSEVVIRQADIADTSLSAIDERIGDKIAALPEVKAIAGMTMSVVVLPESTSFFIIQGYAPGEFAIQRFKLVEGEPLTSNRQLLLGKMMADTLHKGAGDSINLSGTRFRVVGIYETGVGWEELGGVMTLRDAQVFAGRPRKVTLYGVKLKDPAQAPAMVEYINTNFKDVYAALSGEFVSKLPDMQNSKGMFNGISFLAVAVGGVGVLNTMLMSVLERTREIGVLRALGWRRRAILGLILREAAILGFFGGVIGVAVAFGMDGLLNLIPYYGDAIDPLWSWTVIGRAFAVALGLGILGGLYPAYRATRLQPVEALRYE